MILTKEQNDIIELILIYDGKNRSIDESINLLKKQKEKNNEIIKYLTAQLK